MGQLQGSDLSASAAHRERPGEDIPRVRYHRFRDYLLRRYGKRIHKIPLDAGFGCPHRGGSDHRQSPGCVYCENAAFSPHARTGQSPPALEEQIARGIGFGRKRYRARGFFAYFQAYTNTYGPVEELEASYSVIRRFPEILGLAVGTRPDCAGEAVLDVLESFCQDYEVWVEYGLQSAHNPTLDRIRRGHTVEDFLDAVERTSRRQLLVCVHVILGLPGETHDEMMATARLLAGLPIQGVKIHHCHVIEGTPLAENYRNGTYQPLDGAEYLRCVCDFLEYLPWEITVHRLLGEAPTDLLLAPQWSVNKDEILRGIDQELERRGSHQGVRSEGRGLGKRDDG